MNFFSLMQNKSRWFFVYLGLFGVVNSIWASALLLFINNKVTGTPMPFFNEYDWAAYGILIIVSFICSIKFQKYIITLTYNLGNELGLAIFNKLRFASYESFLKLGEEKVRTAIADVKVLQNFPGYFMGLFTNILMVIIGISYLLWVDLIGGIVTVVTIVVLALFYIKRSEKIEDDLDEARSLDDIYQQNVNDFLRGFRELKMSSTRSNTMFNDFMTKNRNNANFLTIKSIVKLAENATLGGYLWYMIIGAVLFIMPLAFAMDTTVITNFIVTLLFLMGPTNEVVGMIDDYFQIKVALKRLDDSNETINIAAFVEQSRGNAKVSDDSFESIRFKDVVYEYTDDKGDPLFQLKPLNLNIKKGETIFVTGGNGSGKSTFITLLTGLYRPKSGVVFYNNKPVTVENETSYRDQLSTIFTDSYLFNENYNNFDLSPTNKEFVDLLEKMKLNEIVTFDENNNRILHTLSKGQQKRMALIYSLLERKEVFIFDEWAAEQDPVFRRYFYTQIIPELKAMGKTIIAVTHDDAYFDCAERVLKFNYGKIEEDTGDTLTLQPNGRYLLKSKRRS